MAPGLLTATTHQSRHAHVKKANGSKKPGNNHPGIEIAVQRGMHLYLPKSAILWHHPLITRLAFALWVSALLVGASQASANAAHHAHGGVESSGGKGSFDKSIEKSSEKIGGAEIQAQALAFTRAQLAGSANPGNRIELGAGKVDPRLAMPRCSSPLEFEPQQQNARGDRLLVKVRCTDAQPWALFVPLQYRQWAQALVATRSIARGQTVVADDVALREMPVQQLAGAYLQQPAQAIGMLATRSIAANAALSPAQLTAPKVIKRGDQVAKVASVGSVQVRMAGTAMADGKRDQQIRVKNQRSNRIIKARVVSAGLVEAIM